MPNPVELERIQQENLTDEQIDKDKIREESYNAGLEKVNGGETISPEEKEKLQHELVGGLSDLVTKLTNIKWDMKTGRDKGREDVADKLGKAVDKIIEIENKIRLL